jgi:hypothetical protein
MKSCYWGIICDQINLHTPLGLSNEIWGKYFGPITIVVMECNLKHIFWFHIFKGLERFVRALKWD